MRSFRFNDIATIDEMRAFSGPTAATPRPLYRHRRSLAAKAITPSIADGRDARLCFIDYDARMLADASSALKQKHGSRTQRYFAMSGHFAPGLMIDAASSKR